MSKKAPSTMQLLVIAGFALSCFGILLFLWVTFGGPTPFKAKPYEVKIPFKEATQLAEQSDVRISGVNVGKVQSINLAPNGKEALATVDIDDKYGPLPRSTRAILRTKTLLGETYIELTSGSREGPKLADGGTLPPAQVAEASQLDEIFRTFDPETRAAFQSWMQEAGVAITGQGQSFSYGLAELAPLFTNFDKVFRVLDSQRLAVGQLFRNGATTFSSLRGRDGELSDLIQSSNAVFRTTAKRNRDIEALFRAFPTFQDESKLTLERLKAFALNTDPLMRQLVPAAEQLSPTLVAFGRLAPEEKAFYAGLAPVIAQSPTAFPALRKLFRDQFPPLLRTLDPFLRNLNPVLTGLNLYRREVTSFFANVTAASNAILPLENAQGEHFHYLRAMGPLNPESVATFDRRLTTNRNSAYSAPGWAEGLLAGLPGFDTRQCSAGITAVLDPDSGKSAAFKERTRHGPPPLAAGETQSSKEAKEAEDLFSRIKKFAFAEQTGTASVPAPGCAQQGPFSPIGAEGAATQYQHALAQQGQ